MICVSLARKPYNECLDIAARVPMVEMRLDSIPLSPDQMQELTRVQPRWVATCRPGGLYDETARCRQLLAAVRCGAAYVDVEYEARPELLDAVREEAASRGCRLIISYHHYELTPPTEELCHLVEAAFGKGADRVKVATMALNPGDCARLMSLYSLYPNLIVFGMGAAGKITRIAAPLLGADFTFASLSDGQETAPGQLTLEACQLIYKTIEPESPACKQDSHE